MAPLDAAGESVSVLELEADYLDLDANPACGQAGDTMRQQLNRAVYLRSLPAMRAIDNLLPIWGDVIIDSPEGGGGRLYPDGTVERNGVKHGDPSAPVRGVPRYLVTRRLDGWQTMSGLLKAKGYLGGSMRDLSILRHWGRQVVLAMAKAHETGVCLRDVRPSNILISSDGREVAVAAFEHTASMDMDGTIRPKFASTLDATLFGTEVGAAPSVLLPPECHTPSAVELRNNPQWVPHGTGVSGAAWDAWSLGLTLLMAVAGDLPPPPKPSTLSGGAGFFDFFSCLPVSGTTANPYAAGALGGALGGGGDGDGNAGRLLLRLAESGGADEGETRTSTAAIMQAIKTMSLSAVLPTRVGLSEGKGSAKLASDKEAALAALEQAFIQERIASGGTLSSAPSPDDDGAAWADLRVKMAAHVRLLATELGGSAKTSSGSEGAGWRVEEKVMGALVKRDKAGVGLLAFDDLRGALVDDLMFPLNDSEVRAVAAAALDPDSTSGQVAYMQLRPLLTETEVVPTAPCWSLLDVLALCLRADPTSRTTPSALLDHPFFDLNYEDAAAAEREAESFVTAPPLIKDWVEANLTRPLRKLHTAVSRCMSKGDPLNRKQSRMEKGAKKRSGRDADDATNAVTEASQSDLDAPEFESEGGLNSNPADDIDLSVVSDLLHLLTEIVRDDDATTMGVVMGRRDPREARWLAAHRPGVVDEVMRQESLEGLASLALRLLEAEDKGCVAPTGFLEGNRELQAGARMLHRLEKLGQQLLLGMRDGGE